jgi:hypothetical protein
MPVDAGGVMEPEPPRSSTDIAHLVLGVGSGAWQLASRAIRPFWRLGGGVLDALVATVDLDSVARRVDLNAAAAGLELDMRADDVLAAFVDRALRRTRVEPVVP